MTEEQNDQLILAEERSVGDTLYDRIRKFYLSPDKFALSASETEIHNRWQFAFNMLLARFKDVEVVELIQQKFKPISRTQAYDDLRQTKLLFGDVMENNEKLERYLRLQSAKELEKVAWQKMDYKLVAVAIKLQNEIAPVKDIDEEMWKRIQKSDIHIHVDALTAKILDQMADTGVVNLNDIPLAEEVND